MASSYETQERERGLESGIPESPSILDFSTIPQSPQLPSNTRESPKILSKLSNSTAHLFHTRRGEHSSKHNTRSETHLGVFSYQSPSVKPVPSVLTPPVTESPVSIARTSPPLTAGAVPAIEGLRTCTHQKGKFYIHSAAHVPIAIQMKWEQEFNPRLNEEFRRLNLNCVSANLFVAGRHQAQLVPTIAILSSSFSDKKRIRKSLKCSKLLTDLARANVQLEILVDSGLGEKGLMDSMSFDSRYRIEGLVPGALPSFHGVLIRPVGEPGSNLVCATLGGIVAIDETLYGLTVGHAFAQGFKKTLWNDGLDEPLEERERQTSQSTNDLASDGDDESISDGDSSTWSEYDLSFDPPPHSPPCSDQDTVMRPNQNQQDNQSQSHGQAYHHLGSLDALAWADDRYMPKHKMEGSIYASLYQFQKRCSSSDWALMTVDPALIPKFQWRDSQYKQAAPVNRAKMVNFASKESILPDMEADHHSETAANTRLKGKMPIGSRSSREMVVDAGSAISDIESDYLGEMNPATDKLGAQVEIFGGKSGFHAGILNECASSIFLQKNMFNVRLITLQNSLERGDSGAWVTQNHQVCGMVIAGGGTIPFAYMLPIASILRDIHSSLGVEVTIPSAVDIKRILRRQGNKARPHSTSTKKIPDTPKRLIDPLSRNSTKMQPPKLAANHDIKKDFHDRRTHSYQEKRTEKKSAQDTKSAGENSTASDIKGDPLSVSKPLQVDYDLPDMSVSKSQSGQSTICPPFSLTVLFTNITRTINIVERLPNFTRNISRQLRSESINVLMELNRSAKWIAEYHGATIKAVDKDFLTFAFEAIKLECDFISNKCRTFQLLESPHNSGSGIFGAVREWTIGRVWQTRQDSGIMSIKENAARLKQTNDGLFHIKYSGLHPLFKSQGLTQPSNIPVYKENSSNAPDDTLIEIDVISTD